MTMPAVAPGTRLPSGETMPDGDYPSLLIALQEQFGLKLDPAEAPAPTIVVDEIHELEAN
jgi:uncharacterized protein (TIGR03435 family)